MVVVDNRSGRYARAAMRLIAAPLIGVSTSEMRIPGRVNPMPEADPPTRELALGLEYPRSIERRGALPVVLAPLPIERIDALLDRLGGLLLSGGPDLDPAIYDAPPHPALGPTEPELDRFEVEMVRRADARGMPVLALCRGAQVLNVARGGSLIQDLPDAIGTTVEHRQSAPGRVATHGVRLLAGSRLEGAMGRMARDVNSFHHQAVDRMGRGLRASAWAPDGVIEAVEAVDRDFVVGVQWHAESLAEREDQAGLFSAFIAAAVRYEQGAGHVAAPQPVSAPASVVAA